MKGSELVQSWNDATVTLRMHNRHREADRIAQLRNITMCDDEEPDVLPESLEYFTTYMIGADEEVPEPSIGITHKGYVEIMWRTDDILLCGDFDADGFVKFSMVRRCKGKRHMQAEVIDVDEFADIVEQYIDELA